MLEGKKIMVEKLQKKRGLLLPGWNVASVPDFPLTIHAREGWNRVHCSGVLAEDGTSWSFLADKLHSCWKPRTIKEDVLL